ncbi:MAG TPA: 7-cyano-7-deazaguanine synthase [Solirubrobacteraceae bacterium]|nr:7-cyano-7-deazaguanine synthase [Solirubrobacteraceae bacterium]
MKSYAVVVNDCAAPAERGILALRSRDTDYGKRNFSLRLEELAEGLPGRLDGRALDWLEILGHLFAVDLACERGYGDVDWTRRIKAWLPVRTPDYWEQLRPTIEGIWSDLTGDQLELRFEQDDQPADPPRQGRQPFPGHDCVALLSGGQDSFVGALQLLDSGRTPLLLSHSASGAVNAAQNSVEAVLRGMAPQIRRIKLGASKARSGDFPGLESSQRSRTFLFVGAAAVIAARGHSGEVMLNENGIMALHVPLTAARIGSFSTHTASPPILARMAALATTVLGSSVTVTNLLVSMTKPEVVGQAVTLGHSADMNQTVSCWQIGRTSRHCGICAPCLLRRISCERHGVPDVDYAADVFNDAAGLDDERARDNLTHLISLIEDLADLSDVELELEYPELLSAEPALTLADAIALHRRWAIEASSVLFAHPVPISLR